MKRISGTSPSKYADFVEDKPLASELQEIGCIQTENQTKKLLSTTSTKRPSVESTSCLSFIKKTKFSDASEIEANDCSRCIPIAPPMNKAASGSSSSSNSVTKRVVEDDYSLLKKINKNSKKITKKSKLDSKSSQGMPNIMGHGKKWTTLVHNGVIFPPPYEPHGFKMLYEGKPVDLTPEQEEVATMYAVMLETDYVKKERFNKNFFNDWRKLLGNNHVIQDLKKCDFTPIFEWHLGEKEKKKLMSTEEKIASRRDKMELESKYMWAIVDGVNVKVGNFRVEPPGLFRGRGEHPKMGKLKRRIRPSDIKINIGKDAPVPECPIPGQRWKEVRHDNTVTWLACWNDPVNPKEFKYVFLVPHHNILTLKSYKEKYEEARKLKEYIQGIRAAYTKDFTSKDVTKQQVSLATHLIDKLTLSSPNGNEKEQEDDNEANTVGCCTSKAENVKPIPPDVPMTLEEFLSKVTLLDKDSGFNHGRS